MHPISGERYAVQIVRGVWTRAAGPLGMDDDTPQTAYEWIANAPCEDAEDDAVWLSAECLKAIEQR
jgi:hypothetical protein